MCCLSGVVFHYVYLLHNASLSFCTSWQHWSHLLLGKVFWETQACKLLALYQAFGMGSFLWLSLTFAQDQDLGEQSECLSRGKSRHFRYTRHLYRAESCGTKLAKHTHFGPAARDQCNTLWHPEQPYMAVVMLAESHPQSKAQKRQDFANMKLKF